MLKHCAAYPQPFEEKKRREVWQEGALQQRGFHLKKALSQRPPSSRSRSWRLQLGCQRVPVAPGLGQQFPDWQPLITATRQNRAVKYYHSPLCSQSWNNLPDFSCSGPHAFEMQLVVTDETLEEKGWKISNEAVTPSTLFLQNRASSGLIWIRLNRSHERLAAFYSAAQTVLSFPMPLDFRRIMWK